MYRFWNQIWNTVGSINACYNSNLNPERPIWDSSVYQMIREVYVDIVGKDESPIDITGENTVGSINACYNSNLNPERPIWDSSVYQMMREVYVDIVGEDESSIDVTGGNTSKAAQAMKVPYKVQYITPYKGRGIIATELIPKYQIVWDAEDHAVFNSEFHFKEFLERIGYDLACDVIMWAYVEYCQNEDNIDFHDNIMNGIHNKTFKDKNSKNTCFEVAVELGDASFMNDINENEEANVIFCGIGEKGKLLQEAINCDIGSDDAYSSRDINPGEELLIEYNLFSFDDQIMWFDNVHDAAWKLPELKETLN